MQREFMKIQLLVVFCLCLLSANPSFAFFRKKTPVSVKSEYLSTVGGGFMRVGDTQGVVYAMTFQVRKKSDKSLFAVVTFENPIRNKGPLLVELEIVPGQEEILVQSPVIKKIKNGKNYKVKVEVFFDEKHTNRVGEHIQKVQFYLPPEIAKQIGLELI